MSYEFKRGKLPFKITGSTVNTGYNEILSSSFKPNTDIVNLHNDIYGGLENQPIQSPFTNQHVGGNQHRHIKLNDGNDNDYSRPESFKINVSASTIKVYGPDFEDPAKPRAQLFRGVKSSINVSNIQNKDSILGNFSKNYEVVQTVGRRTTNNLIVDNLTASNVLTTQFITGIAEYTLPNIANNSKSVFVERFSAPGSKAESSRGALDRESEEYSPNNVLTTRNIQVRQPFYNSLTSHSPQFGSSSVDGISIHKVNRNSLKTLRYSGSYVISSSEYDNFWVQRAIPRNDLSYLWITQSAQTQQYDLIGYQKNENDIEFNRVFDYKLSGVVSVDTQTLQSSLSSSDYSYGTWKQIRGYEHPVSIRLRNNNYIAVENPIETKKIVFSNGTITNVTSKRSDTSALYREPSITNKYKPIEQDFTLKGDTESNIGHKLKYTFVNNEGAFANKELNQKLSLQFERTDFYDRLLDLKNTNIIPAEQNPFQKMLGITYSEVIYPREENTYLSGTRARTAYHLTTPGFSRDGYDLQLGTQRAFWRSDKNDRRRSNLASGGYLNSLNYLSTQETGSTFTDSDSGILTDYKRVVVSSSLNMLTSSVDGGVFNSIKLLESGTLERQYFTFTGSIFGGDTLQTYNNILKRGYTYDLSGEWNNFYNDFYELITNTGEASSRGFGALYRNTSLKSYLSVIPTNREQYTDLSPKTEDEVFLVNPRAKYVSFIGGVEVNIGEFVQASSSFIDNYFSQNFSSSNFAFSTLDNGIQKGYSAVTEEQPAYDLYEDYVDDIKRVSKDYSIVPEFTISKHLKYYVSASGGNFRKINNSIFSLDGIEGADSYKSSTSEQEQYNVDYFKKYLVSDTLEKFKKIEKDYSNDLSLSKITLTCKGVKKLLPYNGFYPQERTVQLANLYSEYVDNNLHGGVYNLYNFNDYFDGIAADNTNLTASSISVARAFNKYYMAVGIPDGTLNVSGSVRIFQTYDDREDNWNTSSYIVINSTNAGTNTSRKFGRNVKLLSASNGLNLFIASAYSGTSAAFANGYIFHSTSSNGTNWSVAERIATGPTSGSNFGLYFDALYDVITGKEKLVFAVGAPNYSFSYSNRGAVYTFTGSINATTKNWTWTGITSQISPASSNDYQGTGVSIVSCSAGYQIFCAAPGESPLGSIKTLQSTNAGSSWTGGATIVTAESASSGIGTNNLKAVNYSNRNYLFFSEPYLTIGANTNAGAVYVISSSTTYSWATSSTKTVLLTGSNIDDYVLNNSGSYSIEAGTGGGKLFYALANSYKPGASLPPTIYLGDTSDGLVWKTNNEMLITTSSAGANTIASTKHIVNGTELPVFFASLEAPERIHVIKNNVLTQYSIKVDGMDKYFKQAALEPLMSPGILYNTIKSGLAVDWPCATGSQTSIEPYGEKTIVNAYYPKAYKMFEYDGPQVYQSAYGLLRSNIDYRIPFENLLFPDEAFEPKEFLSQDLLASTNLTALADTDPVSQFLDKCYIYGGYEPYISPYDFGDINNLGPKKYAVPFVYRRKNPKNDGLYTLAMSNFLAETVKFFLKDEKLITFTSLPDLKWKQFKAGTTYYMDIVLEKSSDLIMMEAYRSNLHPTGTYGEKMDGRYFGYPVNKTNKDLWTGTDFTDEESKLIHNDPAYAPYTPPYFEGTARARISFTPPSGSRKYTLEEILETANIENIFIDVAKSAHTGSDAYVNKMPIGSSIDLFGEAQAVNVTITTGRRQKEVAENLNSKIWVISPKMETPVLDFSNQEFASYVNDYSKTSGFGRGMWSGKGDVPSGGKGIKLRLEYPYARSSKTKTSTTASLLEYVGFKAEEKNVGRIADTKIISEAVIAIPYLEYESPQTVKNNTGFNFISIDKNVYQVQKTNIENGEAAVKTNQFKQAQQDIQNTSISDMINKMKNYVIPPEFNFLQYDDINPFVMYIFEFQHTLDQQDLANIWQGYMPKIAYNAELDEIKIEHRTGELEFFGGKSMPEGLKWLVFRVKRKAEIDYFKITASTKDDQRFDFNKIIGRALGTDVYSYNWPYDYFSLVELAKLEVDVDYENGEE